MAWCDNKETIDRVSFVLRSQSSHNWERVRQLHELREVLHTLKSELIYKHDIPFGGDDTEIEEGELTMKSMEQDLEKLVVRLEKERHAKMLELRVSKKARIEPTSPLVKAMSSLMIATPVEEKKQLAPRTRHCHLCATTCQTKKPHAICYNCDAQGSVIKYYHSAIDGFRNRCSFCGSGNFCSFI